MDSIRAEDLIAHVEQFRGKKIAIIGDLMLDRYIWGSVVRISPEAPVPVVEVESESDSFGGAANVANNVRALGALAIPLGVIGRDAAGNRLLQLARESGFPTDGIVVDDGRPTTTKTRVIAHNQHVVRVDRERKDDISPDTAEKLLQFLQGILPELDAIVLEDYNKGLLTQYLVREAIALARERDLCITVDPKFHHFFDYQHVTVFKPNRKETEEALGMKFADMKDIREAAQMLKKRLQCQNVLITLGEQGMLLLADDHQFHTIPTRARKVHDVSGAGDTVIGTLTTALASGASILEASVLANYAAGVVVGEVGAVPITPDKLIESIRFYASGAQP